MNLQVSLKVTKISICQLQPEYLTMIQGILSEQTDFEHSIIRSLKASVIS